MKTLSEFIAEHDLKFSFKRIPERRDGLMDDYPMRHWRTWIIKDSERMQVTYSQGMGIEHAPTLEDVLNCLASDVGGILNARDFEDWAPDYGYDINSRKAKRIWNGCMIEREGLERLLGETATKELVFEVEQL